MKKQNSVWKTWGYECRGCWRVWKLSEHAMWCCRPQPRPAWACGVGEPNCRTGLHELKKEALACSLAEEAQMARLLYVSQERTEES